MRTFDHFNPGFGAVCPVCKTAADAETVLVPIPGTEDERICEAGVSEAQFTVAPGDCNAQATT
jgi:hypothetical protein